MKMKECKELKKKYYCLVNPNMYKNSIPFYLIALEIKTYVKNYIFYNDKITSIIKKHKNIIFFLIESLFKI